MSWQDKFYFNFSTVDHIGIGFFKCRFHPQEDKFIVVNNTFVDLLGFSNKQEFKQLSFSSLFANSKERDVFFNNLKENGKVKFFEAEFVKADNSRFWVAITAAVIGQGLSQYFEGIVEDISAHKDMEKRLELERDYMQNLLDNIPDAIYFKDKQNRIIKVNKFYAQGMGLAPEQIVGKTDFDFFPAEQASRMAEDDNFVLNTGKPIIGKVERTLLPNGNWNQVITTKIPMYDTQGNIIGTMGITRDMTAYAHLEHERLNMVMNGLNVLVKALEMRDPYTFSHTRRVADISEAIGKELGWEEDRILGLRLAAELHDLGKISIPLDILNKPGILSDIEYRFIQEHVSRCYHLIKDIPFPFPLAQTIYQHHERLDGSGYPRGIKAEQICQEARVLAVGDVLEAMTHRRPYREALGIQKAKEELQSGRGNKYDEQIVDALFGLLERNNDEPFWPFLA